MKARGSLFCWYQCKSSRAFLAVAFLLLGFSAQAALTHRYSFTSDVSDSVGNANGTIQGNVSVGGGVATFPGQANTDYIQLPPGLISNYTSVTFEMWVDVGQNGTWEELYAFGNQDAGGAGANMLMFCPHTGSTPADFRMSYAQADPGYNDEHVVNGTGVLDGLGPMSVTCVYDPPNNAMSLYTNGVLVGTLSPVTTGTGKQFSLTNVYNVNSWLGRSLYNADSPYNGTIDEFRIYDAPLGPLQIFANNAAGPNTIVTNIAVNSITWIVNSNMVVGSRQDSQVTFNTASYGSVTLAGATEASYTSSDPNTVSVNKIGQLFAKAVGSTTVSAAFNGKTNSVLVTVTDPQLIHRYSFTSDASDSVGGANGTLVGSATISNGAVQLPGGVASNDPNISYVNLPNNLLTNLTAITIETWVTDAGSGTWARVWDLGNSDAGEDASGNGSRYMFLTLQRDAGNTRADIRINDRGGENILDWPGGGRPAVGTEAHVVYTSDIASQIGRLYVNGMIVAVNNNMFVTPADIGPSLNDWLGRSQYAADPGFMGSIDEFRIYNGALSPLQVALDAASGPNTVVTNPGPVQSLTLGIGTNKIYYAGLPVAATLTANFQNVSNVNVSSVPGVTFQSSDPTIATIASDGTINGISVGNATLTASYGGRTATFAAAVVAPPGYTKATLVHRYSFSDAPGSTTVKDSVGTADGNIVGQGAKFDGSQLTLPGGGSSSDDPSVISAYVDLPNHIINVLKDLSVEAWITWQGSSAWQRIFDFGTSSGGEDVSNGNGNYLFMTPSNGSQYRFSVRDPVTGTEPAPLSAPTALPANQEVYVAVTYDFSANAARLYSNAVLVAYNVAPVDITTIDDVNNWLGRSQWGDPLFQGKFNEFRIWNGVLGPDQITSDYAAGPDSLTPPPASPKLSASASNGNISISWPATATGFNLQSTPKLGTGATWTAVSTPPTTVTGVNTVTVPIGAGSQFFRLAK